jgi:hypothetical protein
VLNRVEPGEAPAPYSDTDIEAEFDDTVAFWRRWLRRSSYSGRWREMVHRSALALKLLTYAPTGAIVAAPTTSLLEVLGGARNWDYRYTWMRDSAFTLYALLRLGFTEEAGAFMNWLEERIRHAADREGAPLQIMYGIDGREDLPEEELSHLEGYMGSAPVRIGNGAATQLQLDIYGELMDSLYLCNKYGLPIYHDGWVEVTRALEWLMDHWDQPHEGIWEVRGGRRDFTYSRLMSWVAVERGIRIARQRGLPGDIPRWSAVRDRIYNQILERGWHPDRRAFVQHYDTDVLDASVLLMPLCKFVAPTDPRWTSTLDAITAELVSDSLVYRCWHRGDLLHVLVLVGGGTRPRRATRRGAAGLREDARLRQPRRPVLGGDRAHRRAARQLPPSLHPPGPDQRRLQPRPPTRMRATTESRRTGRDGAERERASATHGPARLLCPNQNRMRTSSRRTWHRTRGSSRPGRPSPCSTPTDEG